MTQTSLIPNETVDAADNPLFWQATSFDTLWAAWERVKANQGAPGGDGVTVQRFDFFARQALESLSQKLRAQSYRPGPSRQVYIAKKSGGTRPLDIPSVIDRVAQGAVALTLGPKLDRLMEPSSFAYRPGRGVADAVARVSALRRDGYTHVVDADIRRYFESVPHDPLLAKLEQAVGEDAVLDLVALWLEWHGSHGRGLPQGSPLSPLLANLYLDALDEDFEARGMRIVRYADDFLLLCRSPAIAEGAMVKLKAFLDGHGLELNPEKTRVVPFERGFRFLGHLFLRSMVLKEVLDETPPEDAIAAAEALNALAGEGRLGPELPPLTAPMGEALGERAYGQNTLYIVEPGRHLETQGESFRVTAGPEIVALLPKRRLDRIELGPGCTLDIEALDLAAAAGVEIHRVDGHGETLGLWSPPETRMSRAKRHLAQAAVILDPEKRLGLARILVGGRIRGQRALLHRANRDRKNPDIAAAAARMNMIIRRTAGATSLSQAMGFEGEAGALYWPALGRALDAPMNFSKRRRKPTGSAFDLILNGLAALLARDIRVALSRAGLHAGFPVLHEAADGEDALAYDLMEEFRAPLMESVAVALVNRRAVTPDMFDSVNGAPRMGRQGWAALVRGYEAACARAVESPQRDGQRVSWRILMDDQAQLFAAHAEGRAIYEPVILDY